MKQGLVRTTTSAKIDGVDIVSYEELPPSRTFLHTVIESSLRTRGLVFVVALAVMVFGIMQLREMPRDVLPEFRPPTVEIQTEALGLSATEVEQLITVPLEQDLLNGVAFLDIIRSESIPSLSSIELIFEPGTDILSARQVVQERLTQAHALPNVSKPPQMIQPLSASSRVMMVGLSSQELSVIDMSVLARWTIRPALLGVPGVANVSIWGQRERQLQVQVDPEVLRTKNVTLDQVIRTAGNALWFSPLSFLEASTPGTGGFIDTPNQRLGIQHVLPIRSAADLAQAPLEKRVDAPADTAVPTMRLGDVAQVVQDHQPLIGDAIINNGSGLMLVIEKFPEANVVEVTDDVEETLNSLKPGLSGIEIDSSIYRPANYIEDSTDNLLTTLFISLGLLAVLLFVYYASWRAVLISIFAIILSLAVAGLVLSLRGVTLNAVVLAGLILALVVIIDDVIADTHGLMRGLRQRGNARTGDVRLSAVMTASLQNRRPLAYATLIILLALLPLAALISEADAFIAPLLLTYALAVLASFIVAIVVTPGLSLLLLDQQPPAHRWAAATASLQERFSGMLSSILKASRPVYIILILVALLGFLALPILDRSDSLLPSFKERDILVRWDGAPGTSLTEMDRIITKASNEIGELSGVRNVGVHVGRAEMSDRTVGVNAGELWVSIYPGADLDATTRSIRSVVNGYPGLDSAVTSYQAERVGKVLAGTDKDLTVRVYGNDLGVLRTKAEEVKRLLKNTRGVIEPKVELQPEEPTIEVKVDLAKAQQQGIKPGDVRRAAATLLSGIQVGNLFEDQKVFEVVAWGVPEARQSLSSVSNLLIDKPDGGHVRVGEVAEVAIKPAVAIVKHENVSRSVTVTANVEDRDINATAKEVESKLRDMDFPLEHHAQLISNYKQQETALRDFLILAITASIGIFLLLQAAFGSWRLASVSLLVLPLSLVGGIAALLLDNGILTIGAFAGLLAVFAITIRNLLTLTQHFRLLEATGLQPGPDLVTQGTRDRLGPILLTGLSVGLLLIPFVFLGNVTGYEIIHPMAVVVLGGLVTSTLLSIFAIPFLYLRFGTTRTAAVVSATTSERARSTRTAKRTNRERKTR